MKSNAYLILVVFIFTLISSLAFCQETLTITTYYPSPYGSYNELSTTGNTYLATNPGNKVGIGTSSPNQSLSIVKANPMIGLQDGTRDFQIGIDAGLCKIAVVSPGQDLNFSIGGLNANTMRIQNTTGNVGIGTDNPQAKLHVSNGSFRIADGTNNNGLSIWGDANTNAYLLAEAEVSNNGFFDIGVWDSTNGWADASAKLRLDASTIALQTRSIGNVGIGTANPGNDLHISASSGGTYSAGNIGTLALLKMEATNTAAIANSLIHFRLTDNTVDGGIGLIEESGNRGSLVFIADDGGAPAEKMRINSYGNVGIGTPGPVGKFNIYDNGTFDPSNVGIKHIVLGDVAEANGWRATGMCSGGSTGGPDLCFAANIGNWWWGTQADANTMNTTAYLTSAGDLYVTSNGFKPGGGAWGVASDIRLKKNVHTIRGALEKMLRLRGMTFEWREPEKNGNLTGTQRGLIGQEVEKVFPGWVGTEKSGYKTLTIRGFEALTVEAMRELKAENEALKARIEALEAKVK